MACEERELAVQIRAVSEIGCLLEQSARDMARASQGALADGDKAGAAQFESTRGLRSSGRHSDRARARVTVVISLRSAWTPVWYQRSDREADPRRLDVRAPVDDVLRSARADRGRRGSIPVAEGEALMSEVRIFVDVTECGTFVKVEAEPVPGAVPIGQAS